MKAGGEGAKCARCVFEKSAEYLNALHVKGIYILDLFEVVTVMGTWRAAAAAGAAGASAGAVVKTGIGKLPGGTDGELQLGEAKGQEVAISFHEKAAFFIRRLCAVAIGSTSRRGSTIPRFGSAALWEEDGGRKRLRSEVDTVYEYSQVSARFDTYSNFCFSSYAPRG